MCESLKLVCILQDGKGQVLVTGLNEKKSAGHNFLVPPTYSNLLYCVQSELNFQVKSEDIGKTQP